MRGRIEQRRRSFKEGHSTVQGRLRCIEACVVRPGSHRMRHALRSFTNAPALRRKRPLTCARRNDKRDATSVNQTWHSKEIGGERLVSRLVSYRYGSAARAEGACASQSAPPPPPPPLHVIHISCVCRYVAEI